MPPRSPFVLWLVTQRARLGRCLLPCGFRDSFTRNDPVPADHLCLLLPLHPGPCDFIGPCAANNGAAALACRDHLELPRQLRAIA